MIDLTKNTAADLMFIQITSMEPTPERSNMIREFCKIYWDQLSKEHRKSYRRCYVNPEIIETDDERRAREHMELAGEAAYNYGMAKQDREMMDY